MNNNDDKERWETFCKLYDKLSSKEEMRELFEEEIKCFSLYLSHVNQDYVYNASQNIYLNHGSSSIKNIIRTVMMR